MRPRLRLLYAYRVTFVVLQRHHRLSQELSIIYLRKSELGTNFEIYNFRASIYLWCYYKSNVFYKLKIPGVQMH